ncbi:ubiquitin carboxyl-terminal hydrolase 37-like isoform X1 [Xyrichtys novacula]|uniref:Ubiquitin carboxyl-terminal hydrolase 37-like isoform X1 n=1 Tax=Xyrichtys novacula TaxID=13765 RepID=A0AAV1EWT3_XYRNO|nr:ubiquitin carboxyl-terminal hydrolase 37-like isoform X1 [Xyrichtys novacula]
MRHFMALRDVHLSTDRQTKGRLLQSFKKAFSDQEPQFRDDQQKDAHEFLTTVLNQISSPASSLTETAARNSRTYTCPVEDNMAFKMKSTRTCKSCGDQSRRTEEFTNLSLNLVPGSTVENMIEDYLTETELEYKCSCGGNTSRMRVEFETMPRVLILHLKRFCYTSSYELMKIHQPVELSRDLVISSKQGGRCYSLCSTISHLGYSGEEGHYICDSIDQEDDPNQPTDHWLTFNDSKVTKTTGWSVCERRQRAAYILFYTRQD